jgi:hypothetical protein
VSRKARKDGAAVPEQRRHGHKMPSGVLGSILERKRDRSDNTGEMGAKRGISQSPGANTNVLVLQ